MTSYNNWLNALIVSMSKGRRKRKNKKTLTSGSLISFSLEYVWGPKFDATVGVEEKKIKSQKVGGVFKLKVTALELLLTPARLPVPVRRPSSSCTAPHRAPLRGFASRHVRLRFPRQACRSAMPYAVSAWPPRLVSCCRHMHMRSLSERRTSSVCRLQIACRVVHYCSRSTVKQRTALLVALHLPPENLGAGAGAGASPLPIISHCRRPATDNRLNLPTMGIADGPRGFYTLMLLHFSHPSTVCLRPCFVCEIFLAFSFLFDK